MKGLIRVGVDVGGTNTDAVVLRDLSILAKHKAPTSANVADGIADAVGRVLRAAEVPAGDVDAVMIGTTHFTNAFVEARGLCQIGVLRLGAPASVAVRPLIAWPRALRDQVLGHAAIVPGGYNYDGRPIADFDAAAVRRVAREFRERQLRSIAISSVFSSVNADMERQAEQILRDELPDVALTLAHEVGRVGLIERENAAAMNAALAQIAGTTVDSFQRALSALQIAAPMFISQNDGTLLHPERVARHPVLTFASGPTNSMRGAAYLTKQKSAIVIDIGGTTSDFGAISGGFPRESSVAVDIGGVRTNFRMPDVFALGLGGGSLVEMQSGKARIGPRSVGFRLLNEALVFGGNTLTATDIAVAAGHVRIGDAARVRGLDRALVEAADAEIHRMLEAGIDRVKTNAADAPVVLVGGGSILVGRDLKGASDLRIPADAGVANAIGAAIAQVSGEADRVFSYETLGRDAAIEQARGEAIAAAVQAGATPVSVDVLDIEETPLQYLPGNAVRVRVKAVGDLRLAGQS